MILLFHKSNKFRHSFIYNLILESRLYMKEKSRDCTKDEEANIMPAIELIEYEKVNYVQEMEEYLQLLKGMNKNQAKKRSYESLLQSEIITENGEFSERYQATKLNLQKKV